MVGRYAVHCKNVALNCKKHGDSAVGISVPQSATSLDRIRAIYGGSTANDLLELSTSNDQWGFKATGLMSNANHQGKKLALLLFINNRAVESIPIKRGIEQVYSAFLPKGSHPFVYLSLEIEPHRVDVNVHPTKREVHFLHEDEIIEAVGNELKQMLGDVDTSRTFATQSVLPGVKIPTLSIESLSTPSSRAARAPPTPTAAGEDMPPPRRTPATKPYENNLVRTDSSARKITAMFQPTLRPPAAKPASEDRPDSPPPLRKEESVYLVRDKQFVPCRLSSVRDLRQDVLDSMHSGLTEVFQTHTFVGIVDERRRIAAIQSGVKLFLVDYGLACNEYFYQLGLTNFANFGSIRLDPPLALDQVLRVATLGEQEQLAESDWDEVVDAVGAQLVSRRDMLAEYFSLDISADGLLLGLPLLAKGYLPSMAKMPTFLLRLGAHVDWQDEKACFHSFLREVASWHVPESLPVPRATEDVDMDVDMDGGAADEAQLDALREDTRRALEGVLFPGFKARLIVTTGMQQGIVEVANLKGLYRVFERC